MSTSATLPAWTTKIEGREVYIARGGRWSRKLVVYGSMEKRLILKKIPHSQVTSIGLIYNVCVVLTWRVSDCEDLVGVGHRR